MVKHTKPAAPAAAAPAADIAAAPAPEAPALAIPADAPADDDAPAAEAPADDEAPAPETAPETLSVDGATILMEHPEGGTSDAFEAVGDAIRVPLEMIDTMQSHGFVVAAVQE